MILPEPTTFSIETNIICNAKCGFCIRENITRPKGVMSLETALLIAKQMKPHNLVILNSWNEPLATDNFEPILNIFDKTGCHIWFYTNGSLLHKRNIFTAIESCENIEAIFVSFNGGDEKGYEATMDLPFEATRANVTRLFDQVGGKIPINIVANTTDENRHAIHEVKKLFPKASSYVINNPWDVRGFKGKQEVLTKTALCGRIGYYMAIAYNGDVFPCCNDLNGSIVFGNTHDNTIKEIWNSEVATEFRELLKTTPRNKIQLCKQCRE